jgi:chaperone modulatory protein CbpM
MMPTRALDWSWVEPQGRVGQQQLARMSGLTTADLDELVKFGGLVPVAGGSGPERLFSSNCLAPLREAARLKVRYDLDLFTVSLLLAYLQRIGHLEQQVRTLQARVRHQHAIPREGPSPWREPHCGSRAC